MKEIKLHCYYQLDFRRGFMIVINFIFKVIFKTLLVAVRSAVIAIPIGYVVARGVGSGWENMGAAWGGAALIFALMMVVSNIVEGFKNGWGGTQSSDQKFNTILDEGDSVLSSDDDFKWDDDYSGLSLVEADLYGLY
jgi:ABC-type Fe3+ transport system permease subunit